MTPKSNCEYSLRYGSSEPPRVHHLDEAEVRLRAEGEEGLLAPDVDEFHRAVLLPAVLRHLREGAGEARLREALYPLDGREGGDQGGHLLRHEGLRVEISPICAIFANKSDCAKLLFNLLVLNMATSTERAL